VDALTATIRPDDCLVFMSARTPDKGRDIQTMMRNLAMGEHVCAALARCSCTHVVYVSSDAVYSSDLTLIQESSHCSPSTFYGLMHVVRERMLTETAGASNTPLVILRPSLLYGPGDSHNGYGPNRFVRTALKNREIVLYGNGEERRDHVFVDDFARLICLCITHRSEGILNIATGSSYSFLDVATAVAEACGNSVEIRMQPRAMPITHRHFDVTAVKRAFPAFPVTSLAAGLAVTVKAIQ
jgi:nucleoside-diphosphate-sugar epimerase